MEMYRQGDVLIVSEKTIPTTAKKQKRCILALGEVTGHAHQIKEDAFMWVDVDGTKYIEVFGSQALVQHEEHSQIMLSGPGIYRVVQQREYFPEAIRAVAD